MSDEKKIITVDDFDHRLMVNGLNNFRNDLIKEDKPTEDVDELILKVIDAPGLRPATCALMGSPVTLRALSIISFTEKPWPLPRLQTVLAPPAAR